MIRSRFLGSLKADGAIGLVEPSGNIRDSYLLKSDDCLRSAKILLENELFDNSIQMSYYAMYNALLALLFRCGIKSENHAGTILLFKELFGRKELFDIISEAKEGRIETQYYVTSDQSREPARAMQSDAEEFLIQIKLILAKLNEEDIRRARKEFETIG
jgi:uncharacterized protein (UPF0332 family)